VVIACVWQLTPAVYQTHRAGFQIRVLLARLVVPQLHVGGPRGQLVDGVAHLPRLSLRHVALVLHVLQRRLRRAVPPRRVVGAAAALRNLRSGGVQRHLLVADGVQQVALHLPQLCHLALPLAQPRVQLLGAVLPVPQPRFR